MRSRYLSNRSLPVLPDHRRRVVGQGVDAVRSTNRPAASSWSGMKSPMSSSFGQVRVRLIIVLRSTSASLVRREHLVRVGVDDLVLGPARRRSRGRPAGPAPPAPAVTILIVDPGQIGERLEVRGDGRGGGGVLRDEVQRRAAELLPLVTRHRLGGVARATAAEPQRGARRPPPSAVRPAVCKTSPSSSPGREAYPGACMQ